MPELAPADRAQLKKVWSARLHEPLFELLGVPLALANHTNPGWVALSLTGLVDEKRVPFVILYTVNHKQVPEPFDTMIRAVGP